MSEAESKHLKSYTCSTEHTLMPSKPPSVCKLQKIWKTEFILLIKETRYFALEILKTGASEKRRVSINSEAPAHWRTCTNRLYCDVLRFGTKVFIRQNLLMKALVPKLSPVWRNLHCLFYTYHKLIPLSIFFSFIWSRVTKAAVWADFLVHMHHMPETFLIKTITFLVVETELQQSGKYRNVAYSNEWKMVLQQLLLHIK